MIEWELAGYEMSRFSAWYQPAYNHALLPPSLTIPSSDVRGSLCFSQSGKGKMMGQSRCNLTAEWQGPVAGLSDKGTFVLDFSRVWNITSNSSWAHTTPIPWMTLADGFTAYNEHILYVALKHTPGFLPIG